MGFIPNYPISVLPIINCFFAASAVVNQSNTKNCLRQV